MFNFIHKIIGKGTATATHQPSSTFVVSDFHGNYVAFEHLKKALGPNDKVIMLGDACDRGTQGVKILLQVMDDPRFIYLVGNHDDFVLRTYCPQYVKSREHDTTWGYKCWCYNTGPSVQEWEDLKRNNPTKFRELLEWLANCPVMMNFYSTRSKTFYRLAHAAYPNSEKRDSMSWKAMETQNHDMLFSCLWDRFTDGSIKDFVATGYVTVVGHTPVDNTNCILYSGGGSLVDLDCKLGYGSDVVRVLCLDDASLYYLDGKNQLPHYDGSSVKQVISMFDSIFYDRESEKFLTYSEAISNIERGKSTYAEGYVYSGPFSDQTIHTSDIRLVDMGFIYTMNSVYRTV